MNKAAIKYLIKKNAPIYIYADDFVMHCLRSCTTIDQLDTVYEWGNRKYRTFDCDVEYKNEYLKLKFKLASNETLTEFERKK